MPHKPTPITPVPPGLRFAGSRAATSTHRGKIAAALITGFGLLTTPVVHAQTVPELQSIIAQLKAENARLKQAIDSPKPVSPASTPDNSTPVSASAAASSADSARGKNVETAATPATRSPSSETKSTPDSLGDVIVTAQEDIKEVPKSISLVTGKELVTFHVNNFRDIVNRIGNVRTSWQNPNTASIFVRGVGWAAGAGVLDPSVGTTVDGVSNGITSITNLSNYADIESVSVTRGPNGVDGGRAANVGRVTINTLPASFTPEARAEVTTGQLHTVTGTAVVGGPIVDDILAYRISIHRETGEGPYANKNDKTFTWRNTDRTSIRTQFLLAPDPTLQARLAVDITPKGKEVCENCFNFRLKTPSHYDRLGADGKPIPYNYAEDAFTKIQRRWFAQKGDYTIDDYYAAEVDRMGEYPNYYATKGATLNIRKKLLDAVTLTSITGFRDYSFGQGIGSFTPFDFSRAPQGARAEYEQYSQEFRADWEIRPDLRYQGGLYYFLARFPDYGSVSRYGSDTGAYNANASQYALLDVDAPGRYLLLNSADGLITESKETLRNLSIAAYSNLSWSATERLTVNTGLRASREDRKTTSESYIKSEGFAAELDPVSVNNVHLGGFAVDSAGALTAANTPTQVALADSVAQKYFAAPTYAGLSAAQKKQVWAAKGIRAARIGTLYQKTAAKPFKDTLPLFDLSSTYRLTDTESVFASFRHGEKAGISQIVGATVLGGKSIPASKETTNAYEVGFKSVLLDKTLVLNTTLYRQDIRDYIQSVYVYDEVQTALNNNGVAAYISALGNVPKVRAQGVELDASYFGLKNFTFRLAGAFTDARYKRFPRAGNPWELGGDTSQPYYDASGKRLPGAPRFSGNVFVDYSHPFGSNVFHTNANYNFATGYYADTSISRYTYTDYLGVTDFSIGLGRQDRRFDISLLIKNAFDVDTGMVIGAPGGGIAYKPSVPRWIGVVIKTEL